MPVQFYEIVILLVSICCLQEITSSSKQRHSVALDEKCLIDEKNFILTEVLCNKSLKDQEDVCPPGLFCEGGQCECGVYPDYVYC